jgi:sugar phosphate isomerase/epimerase
MRLGINTYTYMWSIGFEGARPLRPMTLFDLLAKTREFGLMVLQIGPNLPLETPPSSEIDRFAREACEAGIELELGTRGLEYSHLERQFALAQRIGATLLRTLAEIGGQPAPAEEIPRYLRAARPLIEASGIRLALENGRTPAAELAAALEGTGVGVVLDTVNSLAVPEGWRYVTEHLAPHTMCVHLKDFIVERAWHMMGFTCEGRPSGRGMIDIPWLLAQCQRSPHPFNVIIELWPPWQSSLDATVALEQKWAEESVRHLRTLIPE